MKSWNYLIILGLIASVFSCTDDKDPELVLTCPSNLSEAAFQSQDSIDAKFERWLSSVKITGGCNASVSNNHTNAPNAFGGSTTVTFTATSSCGPTVTCSATFTVIDDPASIGGIRKVNYANLPADPATGYDPNTGAPIGYKNLFTFFRFSDTTLVPTSDSATGKWDIAFKSSTIIVNSGISGPGTAAAFVYNGLFSELKQVPNDSIFKQDVSAAELAIGKSWYNYDPAAMILTPKPGKVFVIKTANNKYVKMEILSYYKDSPSNPNAFVDQARYYTFRYEYQPDGSKKFE